MYKIFGTDKKEYGPATAEQVRQWIAERRLNAQSLAQGEGTGGWKPLSLFTEFSAALAGSPWPATERGVPKPGAVPTAANNTMAVWSLVCGCIGLVCCPLLSIAGLVMGIVALGQLKASPPQEGRGLAIAGIVLSCLGLLEGVAVSLIFLLRSSFHALGR